MAGTYTVTMDADGTTHTFAGLSAHEAKQVMHHFEVNTLAKTIDMLPEASDTSGDGANDVTFDISTARDSDKKQLGTQHNDWLGISDAAKGALHGAFDAAMAKLDKRLAAKKR